MHMADALITPCVGLVMAGISAAAIGVSCAKLRKDENYHEKLPLLAMTGAFVFAAQMINFTIPGTGSSGHIGGGLLLASLLGPWPALITLAIVLLIQCLLFADGGLLALGCNIFNMAIIPCLIVYPLMKRVMEKNLIFGTLGAALISLPLGAFAVVLETTISGITALPFGQFTMLMVPIHAAIAIGEAIATAAVLLFIAKTRPQFLDLACDPEKARFNLSPKAIVTSVGAAALCIGLGLAAFASSMPDGLEWAVQKLAGEELIAQESAIAAQAQNIQSATSFFPEYTFTSGSFSAAWIAALVGLIVTAGLCYGVTLLVTKRKKAA